MSPIKRILLTIALTCMWSPSFLFIKLAIRDFSPISVVTLRITIGMLIMLGILLWKKIELPKDRRFWIYTAIMAFFSSILPFCLFCYAEQSIDSALAAILNGTSPMFTAVLAQLFVASDRMNTQKAIGILCGSIGVTLLFAPQLMQGVNGTALGMSAAIVAAFCYAMSHVYGKLFLTGLKPYVAPTAQLIASAVMLWPLAIWYDDILHISMPSVAAIGGVCGLAIFGTAIAFILYYKLLDHCGPTAISMVSCFFPVGGMLLGFIFLGESLTVPGLLAAGLILLGMMIVNNVISLRSFNFFRRKSEVNEQ